MSTINDIMDKVLESVATTGGASINLAAGTTPNSGYMVSRAGSERVVEQLTRAEVESYITDHQEELDNSDTYLGTWADPDTGLVYLDISDKLDNLYTAIRAGVEREQLAVYAVEQEETIRL